MKKEPVKKYHSKSLIVTHSEIIKVKLDPHIHENFEIYYNVSGSSKFYINNKVYDIVRGDLFVIPPGNVHIRTSHIGEKCERYVLFIHPQLLKPITEDGTDIKSILEGICENGNNKVHLNDQQHKTFVGLFEKALSCNGYAKDILKYSAAMNAVVFACELFENNKQTNNNNLNDESKINTIIKFIEENLSDDLSPANIAKCLGMKERSINKIFKEKTSTTVYKYIICRRIAQAKKLLLENVPVTKVCESVGFNNYSHFGETFAKMEGISPKKYALKFTSIYKNS